MLILKLVFLGISLCMGFHASLQALNYATPELKRQAETEDENALVFSLSFKKNRL
jgi:hypothetical protein